MAANQAVIALQGARLLGEQTRLARTLNLRVAQRTSELAEVNDALKHEIAERRRTENALRESERSSSLGVLRASIAHEVNQPLSGIITNANPCLRMLSGNPPNVDGALETARRTIRDGNRASEVIARLRALFRKKEVVTEAVYLNEATREVIALSGHDLQQRRISLQTELATISRWSAAIAFSYNRSSSTSC